MELMKKSVPCIFTGAAAALGTLALYVIVGALFGAVSLDFGN